MGLLVVGKRRLSALVLVPLRGVRKLLRALKLTYSNSS